jgi:hypothetical protein
MPVFFEPDELEVLRAVCDRLIPAGDEPALGGPGATANPGAVAAGVPEAIDLLLGAFAVDPPCLWALPGCGANEGSAAGPASGVDPGASAAHSGFVALSPLEELAWRTRIEGSLGIPERERLGPVEGWQQRYRRALAALGADFVVVPAEEQDRRLREVADVEGLIYRHCCQLLYGSPAYGGNRDGAAWRAIGFPGDVQPHGWSDDQVSAP